ncbi:hypothetical protein JRY02_20650 [Enterobacter roggenkampii]|nr:hypothetical protein [Enterobacter roggenkampii]
MNTFTAESHKTEITLDMICMALHALGHHRLWFRHPTEGICTTHQVITWDELIVAERNRKTGEWVILPEANAPYTNPEGICPQGLEELTWFTVHRYSGAGF